MAATLLDSARRVARGRRWPARSQERAAILESCVEINRLENESDRQLADAIAWLVCRTTKDPVAVIKWKEVFEMVEMATDSCEDVANVIEGVVMENS